MKYIILIGIVLLLVGCAESSFRDCERSCFYRYKDNFEYNDTCYQVFINETYNCINIDSDKLKKFCFETCLGQSRSE